MVDAAELAAEVARWTGALLAAAPLALCATKQMMLGGLACGSVEAAFAGAYPAYEAMLASEDAREGMQAFIKKRPPVWRGRRPAARYSTGRCATTPAWSDGQRPLGVLSSAWSPTVAVRMAAPSLRLTPLMKIWSIRLPRSLSSFIRSAS